MKVVTKLKSDTSALRSEMNSKFKEVDARFTQIDSRFEQVLGAVHKLAVEVARLQTLVEKGNSRNRYKTEKLERMISTYTRS